MPLFIIYTLVHKLTFKDDISYARNTKTLLLLNHFASHGVNFLVPGERLSKHYTGSAKRSYSKNFLFYLSREFIYLKTSSSTYCDKHQKHLCPILAHQTIASAHSSFIVLINYKKFMIFLETSSRSLLHSNIQACAQHGAISILQILFFKVEENAWSCVPSIPYCCRRISRSRMVRGTNSSFIFETIGSSANANIDNVLVKCS